MAGNLSGNTQVAEHEIKCLANDLGAEWEFLATDLGFKAADIQKFKISRQYHEITYAIFDMLIAWRERQAIDSQRECLADALKNCNRLDVAENILAGTYLHGSNPPFSPTSPKSPDLDVDQCREDLQWTYLNDVCRIPIYPWDKSQCIDIKDVFTKLSIVFDLPHPFQTLKIPLSSYDEIFNQRTPKGESPHKIIIQGEAGTGKSTLCVKLAYDWANGNESFLRSKKLLFLLRMRDFEVCTDLEDAILRHLLPRDTAVTRDQIARFLDTRSHECCVILDGYDESCYGDDFDMVTGNIASMLSCRTLRKCLIIVTSRPERLVDFEFRKHYMTYEVTGFSENEVESYIRKFFKDESDEANDLIAFIESNSMKLGIASTPLVTHLLCLYWKHKKGQHEEQNELDDHPTTMTRLLNALLNFMHDHYAAKGTAESEIDLDNLILQLGSVAFKALWPPSSQLVFTEDEFVTKTSRETVTNACDLGILLPRSSMSSSQVKFPGARSTGSLGRSNLRTQTLEKKKVEFFHKLGQEHCAGHYLANLAETQPLEFDRLATSALRKPTDALALTFVLLSACGNSSVCAEGIMKQLNGIYFAEIWKHMNRFIRGRLDAELSRNIQQFIELCLQCNFEGEAAGRLNALVLKMFPWRKVIFTGLPAPTAVAFRYFLQHLENPKDIEEIVVNGVPRKGVEFINDSTFDTLSENLLQKYDAAASRLNMTELDRALQGLELPSKGDLAKTQLYQEFEKWEVETDSSVSALLDKLDRVALKILNLRHLNLATVSNRLFEIIGSDGLSALTHLDLANTGLQNKHIQQLARVVHKLGRLKNIILFCNKADTALTDLSEAFTTLKLRWIDLSLMNASIITMQHICTQLPMYGKLLNALHLDGNAADDTCLEILSKSLRKLPFLQRLSITPSVVTDTSALESFVNSIKFLTQLQALQITVSVGLATTFLRMVSKAMREWREVEDLQLGCLDEDNDEGIGLFGDVDESTSGEFLAALDDKADDIQWLELVRIRLPPNQLEELLTICRRHKYKRLQYNRLCLPEDFTVPKDMFLMLI